MNKELSKFTKDKWYIEHFNGYPAYTEMTGSGFTKKLYRNKVPVYKINFSYYKDGEGDWMSLKSDHKRIGRHIIKKHIQDKNFFKKIYKNWLKNFDLLMLFYYKSFDEDISKLSNDELKSWMHYLYDFYRGKVSMPGFIDGYMFYADIRLDYLIKNYCKKNNIKNYQEIFSVLSAPIESSFINEEEQDLKKIARLKLKKQNINKKLDKHLKKYSWIKSSYAGYNEYTHKEALRALNEIINNKAYKKNQKIHNTNKIKKEKVLKNYKFNKEIIAITQITELFVIWQDKRKIYSLTFASLQEKILKEFNSRFGIDINILRYCEIDDLFNIIDDKKTIKDLKKRQESLFQYEKGGVKKIYTGKDPLEFLRKVSQTNINKTQEFKGMPTCLGKVIGKVKIIKSTKDFKKFKDGDVIVAPMTRPEHLIIMKKAKAIITDDGGITCHAAITSRELKIPCIIGTKVATKILKDNNLVEIDANNGIIKILK